MPDADSMDPKTPAGQRAFQRPTRNPSSVQRRSTNACRRCKRRKIKCHYNPQEYNSRCVACSKAHSECLFDSPPDGVLRGHAYVATLEARVRELESELRTKYELGSGGSHSNSTINTGFSESQVHSRGISTTAQPFQEYGEAINGSYQYVAEQDKPQGSLNTPQMPRSDIAVLDILPEKTFDSAGKGATLPALPSDASSRDLVDAVYFYTQARYCIIDWGRLREWHRDRATIAYTTDDGPVDSQTGAFFLWIIYAIGACLIPNSESSTESYFARARKYIPAVISLQDLTTVQALLCLTQYYFRAPNDSPIWDLVGVTIRLCVKMKYHRKKPVDSHSTSPYDVELQKRFFWCAYCFDRLVSMLSKLPFAISDRDIDVETPVDINDTCTDGQKIRNLQLKQESGDRETGSAAVATTMTAAIHHLRIYRIRSRILTQSTGINGHAPSLSDVERFLFELDTWRQEAPLRQDSQNFPQQNPDRVQANYFQAVLTLIRPVLKSDDVEPQLIELCVEFAADACESAKALSLNPLTLPDRITVYHCFYGGITLLQCLAIKPTVLTPRRAHQAISACLSALAVYTRVLPAVAPFLRLYEDVSNLFLGEDHTSEIRPDSKVRALLNKIVSSDPSETPGILNSLSHPDDQQMTVPPSPTRPEEEVPQYDSILGGLSSIVPIDMPLDISPLYATDAEMMDMWTDSWLNNSLLEYPQ